MELPTVTEKVQEEVAEHIDALLLHNAGDFRVQVQRRELIRIKFWCESEATSQYSSFITAVINSIPGAETTFVSTKHVDARLELAFAPDVTDEHQAHAIAGEVIEKTHEALRTQPLEKLKHLRFGPPDHDDGRAIPSEVGAYGGFEREVRP